MVSWYHMYVRVSSFSGYFQVFQAEADKAILSFYGRLFAELARVGTSKNQIILTLGNLMLSYIQASSDTLAYEKKVNLKNHNLMCMHVQMQHLISTIIYLVQHPSLSYTVISC